LAKDTDDSDEDILLEAREAFDRAQEFWSENRNDFVDDVRFARLGKQWPDRVMQDRQREGRPCLTINKMTAFIRQVVNDARQNKPSIKVHPVDSGADPHTAQVFDGLVRNIEYSSSADVAYDTAVEHSVGGGFGYWRISTDYACDDTFDLDINIDRVSDPLLVYGDPDSTAADSSDWNYAFVVEFYSEDEYEKKWPKAEKINWEDDASRIGQPWFQDNNVMVAEYWTREEIEKKIVLMSDGSVLDAEKLEDDQDLQAFLQASGVTVAKERVARSYKVTQYIMSGKEVLETNNWPGIYIPIVPVYGDEVWVDGKRYLRSLIRDAKDAQRMFNFWRTASTELVALAPKAPYIGAKGSFKTDQVKWETANNVSHPFIEYDIVANGAPPQRQPFAGVPAGALQEALNAADDMKAAIGLFDASLGARSNETSGKAIVARQREGDVGTFHFQDNLNRAIRHSGRILLDLIPKVYSERRMVRVIGQDGTPSQVPMGQQVQMMTKDGQPAMQANGLPLTHIFDLTKGKYDLTVEAGPSFTTRREEAAAQMTQLIQAFPQAAPIVGPLLAKNLDWPDADKIADAMQQMQQQSQQINQQKMQIEMAKAQGGQQGGVPPQIIQKVQQLMQQLQEEQQQNAILMQQNQALKANTAVKAQDSDTKQYDAQTERMRLIHEMNQPTLLKTT
jgi:hypothetical protein